MFLSKYPTKLSGALETYIPYFSCCYDKTPGKFNLKNKRLMDWQCNWCHRPLVPPLNFPTIQSLRLIVFLPNPDTTQFLNRKKSWIFWVPLLLWAQDCLSLEWRLRLYFLCLIFIVKDRLDKEPGLCLCLWNWLLGKAVKFYLHWQPGKGLCATLWQSALSASDHQ